MYLVSANNEGVEGDLQALHKIPSQDYCVNMHYQEKMD
jgi:hypothetical protein